MPHITYGQPQAWDSYHLTNPLQVAAPAQFVGDAELGSGPAQFAATAAALKSFLQKALDEGVAAGLVGRGWSFAPLIGMPPLQLDLTGLKSFALLEDGDRHATCTHASDKIALCGGGTTLRELANRAKAHERSFMTSGTHLGPTLGGGAGTASHGSRLGYGGLQDMIAGMHLVTSPNRSVWIERASDPILSDGAALGFADEVLRSDEAFEDVLIHLGAMGVVNGVAVKLIPYATYQLLTMKKQAWPGWLDQIAQGDWAAIARTLRPQEKRDPVFYEATIDPIDWDGNTALHTMYFEMPEDELGAAAAAPGHRAIPPAPVRPGDVITHSGSIVRVAAAAAAPAPADAAPQLPDFPLLDHYADNYFKEFPKPGEPWPAMGWEELHGDVITGDRPGALYNASYAVRREEIARIIPLFAEAVHAIPKCFIFTMRFVSDAAGTLAFTRFPETVVIEIDGASDKAPDGLAVYGEHTHKAALAIKQALDDAGIDYSMHWAKRGNVNAAQVARDYPAALKRWKARRASLLDAAGMALFQNQAVRTYGLV